MAIRNMATAAPISIPVNCNTEKHFRHLIIYLIRHDKNNSCCGNSKGSFLKGTLCAKYHCGLHPLLHKLLHTCTKVNSSCHNLKQNTNMNTFGPESWPFHDDCMIQETQMALLGNPLTQRKSLRAIICYAVAATLHNLQNGYSPGRWFDSL